MLIVNIFKHHLLWTLLLRKVDLVLLRTYFKKNTHLPQHTETYL